MVLEVVVRPVVFPNIRPARPRVLVKSDDPEQGMVVMGGGSSKFVSTSYSYNYSYSRAEKKQEVKRQVDKKRVYQVEDDGSSVSHGTSVNKDNFIDIEVTKKILLTGGKEPDRIEYAPYKDPPNVEVIEADVTKYPDGQ